MHPWNQPILETLGQRLDRLPHALLVRGVRGTGKLALAERVAQQILCEAPKKAGGPCGSCDGCRWYTAGNHPDFRRLEPESLAKEVADADDAPAARRSKKPSTEIRVDQVRELADFLNISSHRGGMRVAIVHPAEEMNANAANALLKALEEPPSGAVFILVSHRAARLLATIRSRCVSLPVPLPKRKVALDWLVEQGVREGERWLAYAGGAPLRALEYAAEGEAWDRLMRAPAAVDDREQLQRLAEALQKVALDRAFGALGLPAKYQTGASAAPLRDAGAWLAYAREAGRNRSLARHPLNPKLFSAHLLARRPHR